MAAVIRWHRFGQGTVLLAVLLTGYSFAVLREPFPSGAVMGHLQTICYTSSAGSRCPSVSAVYLNGKNGWGGGVSGVFYFDGMDNLTDRSIGVISGGGWFTGKWWSIKSAISLFDALGVYREECGYMAGAFDLPFGIRVGGAVTGVRLSMTGGGYHAKTVATGNGTVLIPIKTVNIMFAVQNFCCATGGMEGGDPGVSYEWGISTARHAYGAQGIRITVTEGEVQPVRVFLGQELRLHKCVALHTALACNPFLFSLGIEVVFGNAGATVAFVSHPVLGWSRGFSVDYSNDPL